MFVCALNEKHLIVFKFCHKYLIPYQAVSSQIQSSVPRPMSTGAALIQSLALRRVDFTDH